MQSNSRDIASVWDMVQGIQDIITSVTRSAMSHRLFEPMTLFFEMTLFFDRIPLKELFV